MSAQRLKPSNARSEVPDQDSLIVCFADAVRDTALRSVLERERVVADIVPVSALGQALQAAPDRTGLLIYDTPESYIGQRMKARVAPEAALNEWQTAAGALVDVLRPHRDRITLISVDMALHYPGVLAMRLGLESAATFALEHAPRLAPDPVLRVLAGNTLQQDITMQVLAGELEASALNLSNRDTNATSEGTEALMHYLARQAEFDEVKAESQNQALYAEEMFAQLESAQAESGRMQQQLDHAQAESGRMQQQLDHAQAESGRMQQRQAEFDSELGRKVQTITALENTQKVLMQQLDHAQRDLESTYAQVRKVSADRDSRRHDIKTLEQKLAEVEAWVHGIQASRSYRIMEPLRRLRLLMKRKG